MNTQTLLLSALHIWAAFSIKVMGKDFVNLTFDFPVVDNVQFSFDPLGNYGLAADLLPGWTLYQRDKEYRGLVAFFGDSTPRSQLGDWIQFGLRGSVSGGAWNVAYLVDPRPDADGSVKYPPVAISQVGQIPSDAWYLTVREGGRMSINGFPLSYTMVDGETLNWDVSAYAGKEVEVRFDFTGTSGIDIIGFATPEPGVWGLLAFGGAFMSWVLIHCQRSCRPAKGIGDKR